MKMKKVAPSLALAGALAMLLFNKQTLKKAEEIKKLALEMMAKILDDLAEVKKITKLQYGKVVKSVVKDFKKNEKLSAGSWKIVEAELMGKWDEIGKGLSAIRKKAKK
jgi:hypothetical protein